MKRIAWTISIVASVVGGLVFIFLLSRAAGSSQQTSAACTSLCIAIIPYVFARSVSALTDNR